LQPERIEVIKTAHLKVILYLDEAQMKDKKSQQQAKGFLKL
jgi:hypothetical protein